MATTEYFNRQTDSDHELEIGTTNHDYGPQMRVRINDTVTILTDHDAEAFVKAANEVARYLGLDIKRS